MKPRASFPFLVSPAQERTRCHGPCALSYSYFPFWWTAQPGPSIWWGWKQPPDWFNCCFSWKLSNSLSWDICRNSTEGTNRVEYSWSTTVWHQPEPHNFSFLWCISQFKIWQWNCMGWWRSDCWVFSPFKIHYSKVSPKSRNLRARKKPSQLPSQENERWLDTVVWYTPKS